jgi:hypothetical protein
MNPFKTGRRRIPKVLVILLMLPVCISACTRTENSIFPVTPTPSTTASTPVWTTPIFAFTVPPTANDLSAAGSVFPDIPRIRAENLKYMMDNAKGAGAYSGVGGLIKWDNFIIVDTLPTTKYNDAGQPLSRDNNIQGSVNIPFTFYWVKNPAKDLRPEERTAYEQEMQFIENNLYKLSKYKPIIIYDDTGTDEAACLMAKLLLEYGYNSGQVMVLWKGLRDWYVRLGYPVLQGNWSYVG